MREKNRTKRLSLLLTVIALLIVVSFVFAACSLFTDAIKGIFSGDSAQQTTSTTQQDKTSSEDKDSGSGSWSGGGSGGSGSGSGSDSGSDKDSGTDNDGSSGSSSGSGDGSGSDGESGGGSSSDSTDPIDPTMTDLVTISTSLTYDKASVNDFAITATHPNMSYDGLMGLGLTSSHIRGSAREGHGDLQIAGDYLSEFRVGKYDFYYIVVDNQGVRHYEPFELTIVNTKAEPTDVKIDYDIACPDVYVTFKCDCGTSHTVTFDGTDYPAAKGAESVKITSEVDKAKSHTAIVKCSSGGTSSMTKAAPDASAISGGYLTNTYSFMGHTADRYVEDNDEAADVFNYLIYKGASDSLETYVSEGLAAYFASDDQINAYIRTLQSMLTNPWSVSFGLGCKGKVVTFSVTVGDVGVVSSGYEDERPYADVGVISHHSAINARTKGSKLPIDDKPAVTVRNVKELLAVVEAGYKPTATGATLAMYNAAKDFNYTYLSDAMTNLEKLHVIYDYLAGEIDYDYSALWLYTIIQRVPSLSLDDAKTLLGDAIAEEAFGFSDSMKETIVDACDDASTTDDLYKSLKEGYLSRLGAFSIEGVLSDRAAVCEGISYTFMLLARIEGIECIQVSGVATNNGSKVAHAWNKVRLDDGKWYCVDATWGNVYMGAEQADVAAASLNSIGITKVTVGGTKYLTHRFFMVSEVFFAESHEEQIGGVAGVEHLSLGDVEYYKSVETEEGHSLYVSNYDDLAAVVRYYAKENSCYYMEFMVDPAYDVMPTNDPPLMDAFGSNVSRSFSISYVKDRVFLAYFTLT